MSLAFAKAQEIKWGEFSQADLELESVSFDPGAKVVTLFEEGKTGLVWRNEDYLQILGIATEFHYRYKILDDNLSNFGNFIIPFYQAGEMQIENILDLQAQVSFVENGVRTLLTLSENDIKLVDLGDGYWEYRLIFPKSTKGSILEYKFIKFDRAYYSLEGWLFQGEYPKLISRYLLEVPDFLQYQLVMQGSRVRSALESSVKRDRFKWEIKDIPAFRFEPYISSPVDYVDFVEGFLSYNSMRPNPVLYSTWENLGDELLTSKEYSSYSKPTTYKKMGLTADIFYDSSKLEIAKKSFEFISTQYKVEPSIFPLPTQMLGETLKKKSGNHMDVNLLYISLLKTYDIDAELILVHQKGMGRTDLIPSPNIDQFNGSIVRLRFEDQVHFVDASDPIIPFGLVSLSKTVERGFLIKPKTSQLTAVRIPHQSVTDLEVSFDLDSLGNLDLKHKLEVTDLNVLSILESLNSPESEEENLEQEPYSVEVEDNFKYDRNLKSSYRLAIKDEGTGILVLNPFSFSTFATNLFTEEERKFPIEFQFPFTERIKVNMDLPEGFVVDEYPLPTAVRMSNDELEFYFEVVKTKDQFTIQSTIQVKEATVAPKSYAELQRFFRVASSKLSEPIVLLKTSKPQ